MDFPKFVSESFYTVILSGRGPLTEINPGLEGKEGSIVRTRKRSLCVERKKKKKNGTKGKEPVHIRYFDKKQEVERIGV